MCPAELTSLRLHEIMSNSDLRRVSLAIKGVGSQGDGSVQVICKDAADQELVGTHWYSFIILDSLVRMFQALKLLSTTLGCTAFTLTIPAYHIEEPHLSTVPHDFIRFRR